MLCRLCGRMSPAGPETPEARPSKATPPSRLANGVVPVARRPALQRSIPFPRTVSEPRSRPGRRKVLEKELESQTSRSRSQNVFPEKQQIVTFLPGHDGGRRTHEMEDLSGF